ncbi:MAG: NFACT RNA binding domain-containing protein [Lachnospiraceae bacterium]|nr:NFACT RNA binding domain-containing protein [Lachnospiraceae bacterium]
MALDGLVISNLKRDCQNFLVGGRIYKIYQPEQDELTLIIKNNRTTYRLLLCANASLPLVYLTTETKNNPTQAPNFCMLLRKHINNGRIIDIRQPGFERILEFTIEHYDELGDLNQKKLIIEIMGKHSNIIFTNSKNQIIDSMKHISSQISSVREVLPGRTYCYPPSQGKISPLEVDLPYFLQTICQKPSNLCKAIYTSVTGISPLIANELCYRAGLDGNDATSSMTDEQTAHLYGEFVKFTEQITRGDYEPNIILKAGEPVEFSSITLTSYPDCQTKHLSSISEVLQSYYSMKEKVTRIKQKSTDLRKIISTSLERASKKYDLQMKQLKDTEKRDKYRIYGELLNTYGYDAEPKAKSLTCLNYYTNEMVTIPLDPTKTALENAKKYFERYNKLKRTYEALSKLTLETKQEVEHLDSIHNALQIALEEDDLTQIKEELIDYGYIKRRKSNQKKKKTKSKPLHYLSSDGYHMYVGKNNYQNEELSFQFATGNDWWFHAKQIAGSHVIVKVPHGDELPDQTFEEASRLAAYYSKGKDAPKVEIDYIQKKHLRKTPGGKPGFVIYHTNYSMMIEPDISQIQKVD